MNRFRIILPLLLAAFVFSGGFQALAQTFYKDDISSTRRMLVKNKSRNNYLRLATLHYLSAVKLLETGYSDQAAEQAEKAQSILSRGKIPIFHPVYIEALYATAFAYYDRNHPYEALLALQALLDTLPQHTKGHFLKGIVLANTSAKGSVERALESLKVVIELGDEGEAAAARQLASRLVYNHSTLLHARGKSPEAAASIENLIQTFGTDSGATARENQQLLYAAGIYRSENLGVLAGLADLEAVYKSQPDFVLNNGVALKEILADVYYEGAKDQIQKGNPFSLRLALKMLDKASVLGDDADVNLHHARAVAYNKQGDQEKFLQTMEIVKVLDPARYDAINTAK